MQQFNQYLENKELEPLVNKCAKLMVELDVDPWETILEWAANENPRLEALLLEKTNEIEALHEQFMKRLGQGLKAGAKQAWSGLKAGAQQVYGAVTGPQAKFENAVKALGGLLQVLQSTPELQQMPGQGGGTLANQIQGIMTQLQQQAQQIPQMAAQGAQNPYQRPGAQAQPGAAQAQPATA